MTGLPIDIPARHKAVWGPGRTAIAAALAVFALGTNAFAAGRTPHPAGLHHGQGVRSGQPNSNAKNYLLDSELSKRVAGGHDQETTGIILDLQPAATIPPAFKQYLKRDGKLGQNSWVLNVPNRLLKQLAAHPSTFRIHYDRPTFKHNYRTSLTTGTRAVQKALGLTGAGIGIAVIDSGIATWHDDLTNHTSTTYPYGDQRVSAFVDFVNSQVTPYDDDGHGSHVAGILAGNGRDSNGQKAGVAPDASLVVLKVLDSNGSGTVSNLIAALDWVLANHNQYNIRVVNMSVGSSIHESYFTDPLTLAAKRVVDAGIVVVTAAGNMGQNALGQEQYGGIGSPANAPWVMTVGASSTNGTNQRDDDTMASFSSRGPTYLDWGAKPDLVAPGVGTVSLAAPGSTLYETMSAFLVPGSVPTDSVPYLSLSGTSMAAPVVAGTVALMLQADPSLTPNAVKAILQYTAQQYAGYDALTEGAGFLNSLGAVRLAQFYATAQPGQAPPVQSMWSQHIIWGNHMLSGGLPLPDKNAFALTTTWGVGQTADGDNIVWGTSQDGDNIVWGTAQDGDNIVWGTADGDDNIVWGTDCGGADCDNIVWGTADAGDNIVWGTADAGDNIVWGTAGLDSDNIVWGTASVDDNIVWGTMWADDNIVWGTDSADDNIVWGTDSADDNIVWGTGADDNIVWGTAADGSAMLFDATVNQPISWQSLHRVINRLNDAQVFSVIDQLASPAPAPAAPPAPPTDPTVAPAPPTDPSAPPPSPTDPSQMSTTNPSLAPPPPPTDPTALLAPAAPTAPTDPTALLAPTAAPTAPLAPPTNPTTAMPIGGGL
jgi:serine protease AprX